MSLYVVRHCKTVSGWDSLGYEDLLALLEQKSDPDADRDYLRTRLDADKIGSMGISLVYCSAAARAMDTAEAIAGIAGCGMVIKSVLNEIRFSSLPKATYANGTQAIREYLVKSSTGTEVDIDFRGFRDGSLIVTHAFLMRRIYSRLFKKDTIGLKNSSMFTEYLSGFDMDSGAPFSIKKDG